MLELYHNRMAVCAAKVRMVLAEKGLEWQGHHLDLSTGETRTPNYLRINPNGVVPTLIDEEKVLIESTVISEYIDDKWPSPELKPSSPFACAKMRLWTKQLDEAIHAATGAITYCISFREAHISKSAAELEAFLAKIPSQEQRERISSAVRLGMNAPQFIASIKRFSKLFTDIRQALVDGPWLAGNEYSLADLAYTPYMTRLEHLGLGALFERDDLVADWNRRLKERPSYKTALVDWFDPPSLSRMEMTRPLVRDKIAVLLRYQQ